MFLAVHRRAIILAALLLAACSFYLFLQPLRLALSEWRWNTAIGAIFVPGALLAFWTALSGLPVFVRVTSGLFAILLLSAALAWSVQTPNAPAQSQSALLATAVIIQFVVDFFALSLIRWFFRWELRAPEMPTQRMAGQFSILALLVWTVEAALLAMLLQYCFGISVLPGEPNQTLAKLSMATMQGLFMAALGLPCIFMGWLVLARGCAQIAGAILTIVALALLVAIVIATNSSPQRIPESVCVAAGIALTSAPSWAASALPAID